jgi:hypothetical protein
LGEDVGGASGVKALREQQRTERNESQAQHHDE